MPNYIVSYDLDRPGQRYQEVEHYLRAQTYWAKLLETVWFVRSAKTATQIRDDLARITDQNDKIIVGQVSGLRGSNINAEAWAQVERQGGA